MGLADALAGKTALVMNIEGGVRDVVAQFDDTSTGFGHGWWLFYRHQFVRARKSSKGWRKHLRRRKIRSPA